MDELVLFLSQHGINASLHVVFENERLIAGASLFNKPKFDIILDVGDPPHWMKSPVVMSRDSNPQETENSNEVEIYQPMSYEEHPLSYALKSLENYEVPEDFSVIYPFTYSPSEVGGHHETHTDRDGWVYSTSFQSGQWKPLASSNSCVRRRKWERLMVPKYQYHHCMCILPDFYKQLTEFRSLHPLIINASIGRKKYQYQIQLVVQHQRQRNGVYSGRYLDHDDPPEWGVGPSSDLCDDPTQCKMSDLQSFDQFSFFDRTKGFDILHEFVYILYPEKDDLGWEYNIKFGCGDLEWVASKSSRACDVKNSSKDDVGLCVRRRLWFRTIVSDSDVPECRDILSRYLSEHPSCVASDNTLLCLSSFGTKWQPVTIKISGTKLEVQNPLKKNKLVKQIDLRDHIVCALGAQDCPGRDSGIGIRLRKNQHMRSYATIFSAENEEDHVFWTQKIEYQMCLVDMSRRLASGPQRSDAVVIKDDMWLKKKVKSYNQWSLNTFELYQSGYMKVFEGAHMKFEYDMIHCKYGVCNAHLSKRSTDENEFCGDGSRFEFNLFLRNRESLSIRPMSQVVQNRWLDALSRFFGEESYNLAFCRLAYGKSTSQVFPEDELSLIVAADNHK